MIEQAAGFSTKMTTIVWAAPYGRCIFLLIADWLYFGQTWRFLCNTIKNGAFIKAIRIIIVHYSTVMTIMN